MRSYQQFCPVAKASEIFAERWTPLILRELLMGSHRFSELEWGLPGIPRSLLVKRLRSLERAGLIEHRVLNGRASEYHLTPAGEELRAVIEQLGQWGQRWVNRDIGPTDIDPGLLMWDMRRRINIDRLPSRRIVVQFDFRGARRRSYWLVMDRGEVSVCLEDPGFDIDLQVTTDTLALHRVWIGRLAMSEALRRGVVQVEGPPDLARQFPGWLALSSFAGVDLPPAPRRATAR